MNPWSHNAGWGCKRFPHPTRNWWWDQLAAHSRSAGCARHQAGPPVPTCTESLLLETWRYPINLSDQNDAVVFNFAVRVWGKREEGSSGRNRKPGVNTASLLDDTMLYEMHLPSTCEGYSILVLSGNGLLPSSTPVHQQIGHYTQNV